MLGAALREGDEANAVPPASEPEIAGEELVEFGVSDAAEALEIGLVERFIRACWIECQIETPPATACSYASSGRSSPIASSLATREAAQPRESVLLPAIADPGRFRVGRRPGRPLTATRPLTDLSHRTPSGAG